MILSSEDMSFSKDLISTEVVLDFMTSGQLVVLSRIILNSFGGNSLFLKKICSKSTVLVSLLMLSSNIPDTLPSSLMFLLRMSRLGKATGPTKSLLKFFKINSKRENSPKKRNTKSKKSSSMSMLIPKRNSTKSSSSTKSRLLKQETISQNHFHST